MSTDPQVAFNPYALQGAFQYNDGSLGPSAATQTVVLAKPNRIALLVSGQTTAHWLRPIKQAGNGIGFTGAGAGNNFIVTWGDFGGLVSQAWTVFLPVGGSTLFWIEVLWLPEGGA